MMHRAIRMQDGYRTLLLQTPRFMLVGQRERKVPTRQVACTQRRRQGAGLGEKKP